MRRECQNEVVLLPEKSHGRRRLTSVSGLENIRLTDEDRRKGEGLGLEPSVASSNSSLEPDELLWSLDMEVSVEQATPFRIPRIAQLTQKTNQMNMTTRRYTEAQTTRWRPIQLLGTQWRP